MSGGIHLPFKAITGHGLTERRHQPNLGVSGVAASSSYSSRGNIQHRSRTNILLRENPVYESRRALLTCMATAGGPGRNPDFSRQKKNRSGFSRGKNRQNDEKDNSDDLEESELLSSKNGPLLSLSGNPRYQATATPGPREKEIVELFRKVQAQLRERAAIKEEKKIEASQGQGERGTVDSLLKLLRKHSVEQGKMRRGSEDFNLSQHERNTELFNEEQNSNFLSSNSIARDEVQEPKSSSLGRPSSNFRRRSPVPQVKYQSVYSTEESSNANASGKSQGQTKKRVKAKPEPELVSLDVKNEMETFPVVREVDVVVDVSNEVDELSESNQELGEFSVASDADESGDESGDESVDEPSPSALADLGSLKLSELRVLAKSRGLKGYSKLKKGELVSLLGENTN